MPATIALVGNPNVGKTAVFNALTGLSQKTGNYPGVTVARKCGRLQVNGHVAELLDLPGTYSLAAHSPDEVIVTDVLLGQQAGEQPIDGLIVVLDAANLERNLYLVSQLLELKKPLVIALNMVDIAKRRGYVIDAGKLSERLGVPVFPICARDRSGIPALKQSLEQLIEEQAAPTTLSFLYPPAHLQAVEKLQAELAKQSASLGRQVPKQEAYRLLVDTDGYVEQRLARALGDEFTVKLKQIRHAARTNGASLASEEAKVRYDWVRDIMADAVQRPRDARASRSERIDNVLTHRVWGTVIFGLLMLLVFQSIFTWAGPFMDAIDALFSSLGAAVSRVLPEGPLQSLIVDGAIAGVGGVLVFLPQILFLSLFIAVLEDCGYMARAAFLMDKLLSWCGLSGQSFIPMFTSFACAIPGVMATRVIRNWRDRFTTILVAPLMSCSARLPVYIIMIEAFFPEHDILGGFITTHGVALFGMYLLGIVVAVPVAYVLKKTLFRGKKPPFLLEMPSYKIPQAITVVRKVFSEGKEFIVRAGTLIFAVAIIVWALAYFPRAEAIGERFEAERLSVAASAPEGEARDDALSAIDSAEAGEYLRDSYLGRAGHWIEPAFEPLGWDWRIATATIASFPAREIIIANLATLFNLGADEEDVDTSLKETLRTATREDGSPLFSIPVALSVMVFFALCCQCAATLAIIKRETGKWRWPALTFAYMTVLAYVAAFFTYHGALLLGLGLGG